MEEEMKLDLEKILNELKSYREKRETIDQAHTALIVIDMQKFFLRIVKPVIDNILKVIKYCREANIPIIFTQHGHSEKPSDGGMLVEWWGDKIVQGTEDWEFLPEIQIEQNDTILPKKRYSAFFETDLDRILRSKGIKDLVITGVMTNLCCETTARDAFMRDYRVFFLVDGTATGRIELHIATLKNLGFGFAYLLTCEEFIKMLETSIVI